jgi:phosphoglycolate phosphatase
MKHDAIIFDLDGTLWDASDSSALGWTNGLKELGIPDRTISAADIRSIAGNPFEKCIDILIPELREAKPECFDILNKHERKAISKLGGTLYPEVKQTLADLAKKSKLFLMSNCQKWYLDNFLKFSGLQFADIDCYGMSGVSKKEMLNNLKVKHNLQSPVYVGDTLGDQQAAEDMDFIYVAYGFGKVENPQVTVNSFTELVQLFQLKNKLE